MIASKKTHVNAENIDLIRHALTLNEISGNFLPSVYVIEPTSRCNIQCVMCPNKSIKTSNLGDMPLPLFDHITKSISPYAEFVMLYWLGEPLLHSNILEILALARSNIRGRLVVSTNMTQVTDEILLSLLTHSDIILCSLDRWEPTAYERIRRGANFLSVVSNINRLIELRKSYHGAEIVVKALDISSSSGEYGRFKEYWSKKGVRPLLAWLNDWAGTFPGLRKVASIPIPQSSSFRPPCADLWFKMVINWRGNIQMCCFDWRYEFTIGSCNERDWLYLLWHSKDMQILRQAHLQGNFAENNLCKSCTTWGETSEHDAYVDFDEGSYFVVF